ncbi:hypothetical protein SAMN05192555_104107 [Franzmannia pantelleriensis]|uniref:Uncharacterized protein n=1 Tax=Franzmannia pantelleriensis TaxID=48727 RepID=A0A1G9JPD4_9GAMM|nr:hypothetical protein [Halomonas pantelleriensis]SDL39427.1 hypothetical protein SAMN05192555_104107 [Halomonas pantelleriensis]
MATQELLEMSLFAFNLVGLVVCLVGLSLARRRQRRALGYTIAVLGFLIAATPMLAQLVGGR